MTVGIIGAGIMGLTLGFRLSQLGYRVHILEKSDQPGGLSTWFDYGDFTWDKYYHVILKQDKELLKLLEELQLNHRLCWKTTRTGFLWNNKLISMSTYREFMQFPILNIFEKFRLGWGILYSRYLQNPSKLHSITAQDWLIELFGKNVFSAVWQPLLESKFGVLKEKIPATLLYATINRYYNTRNKSDGKEMMGYLKKSGLRGLIKALIDKIIAKGGIIQCGEQVTRIIEQDTSQVLVRTDKKDYTFKRLISTLPTVFLKKLIPSFTSDVSLSKPPEFLGVIRLALVINQSLSPYYVTNLIDKNLPYTGIVELSQIVDKKEFHNNNLIMIPRYDIPSSDWFTLSDQEIKTRFLTGLKKTWPSIENHITKSYVHKEKIVQAVWIDGTPNKEPLKSTTGRVWSINAELAGCDTLNNNALVKVANQTAADFIAQDFKR